MAVDHPVSNHFLNFLGPHQKKKSLQISNLLIYLLSTKKCAFFIWSDPWSIPLILI